MVAVAIVVLVGSVNDWQKEKQFQKLNAQKDDRQLKVVRSGKEQSISVYEVLVGDVAILEPGEIVPVRFPLLSLSLLLSPPALTDSTLLFSLWLRSTVSSSADTRSSATSPAQRASQTRSER